MSQGASATDPYNYIRIISIAALRVESQKSENPEQKNGPAVYLRGHLVAHSLKKSSSYPDHPSKLPNIKLGAHPIERRAKKAVGSLIPCPQAGKLHRDGLHGIVIYIHTVPFHGSQVAIAAAAKQPDRAIRFDNNGMVAATAYEGYTIH